MNQPYQTEGHYLLSPYPRRCRRTNVPWRLVESIAGHFTSPIRRYPDLCIHRIIKEIVGGRYENIHSLYGEFVADAAERSSMTERTAAEAEREVDALYTTMYMSERIGKTYDAVVSGVTSYGIFAELKNTIEGIIPTQTLKGEYECIPEKFTLKGKEQSFTIGDEIKIKVVDVDFERRRAVFAFLGKKGGANENHRRQ